METYFYLYQITSLIDGRIYVGVHKTQDLNDGYMGSGTYLRNAQKAYGLENFKKDILHFFESEEEMYDKEAEVVNKDFLQRDDVLNLIEGGHGGWGAATEARLQKLKEDPEFAAALRELNARNLRRVQMLGTLASHSPEAKKKRSDTIKTNGSKKGEKNSQFGSIWATNGVQNQKIPKGQPIPTGWRRGRTQ